MPDAGSTQSSSVHRSRTRWSETLTKVIGFVGGLAGLLTLLWGVYTYSGQVKEQRKQDYLHAYDIVDGAMGKGVSESIDAAIKPVYDSSDDKLAKARQTLDEVGQHSDKGAAAIAVMQRWITSNILKNDKNPQHDRQIQNYQQALKNLTFLYRYAKNDSCIALVVLYRFQADAYRFWYYYPGSYKFDGSNVMAYPEPDPAYQLQDRNWLKTQENECILD